MPKIKIITNATDDADFQQASLIPKPADTSTLPRFEFKVVDIDFLKSSFNVETGSRVFGIKARRSYTCFLGRTKTYTLLNPTWDGKTLGLTMYDVENHRHVVLVFHVSLDMAPRIDSLFSSTPVLA